MLFICYKRCSTCIKAKNWLDEHKLKYEERDIVLDNPSKEELIKWVNKYAINPKKIFNTSGLKYRSLNLKDKLVNMKSDEMIDILSSDGMLIKRPIIVNDDIILFGFKEEEWKNNLV